MQEVEVCGERPLGDEVMAHDSRFRKERLQSVDGLRGEVGAGELQLGVRLGDRELEPSGPHTVRAEALRPEPIRQTDDVTGARADVGRYTFFPLQARRGEGEGAGGAAKSVPGVRIGELVTHPSTFRSEVEEMGDGDAHMVQTMPETGGSPEATGDATGTSKTPGLLVALALNGFFLYLGTLDVLGIEPNSRITGPYYLALAAGLTAAAFSRRNVLRRRLLKETGLVRVWAAAAAILGAWFLLTAVFRSEGRVARDASFLFAFYCLPSVLATLTFHLRDVLWFARGLVATGLGFGLLSAIQLLRLDEGAARFSPVDELNPITAAATAALGALACLALRAETRRGRIAQAGAAVLLVATAVVPGGRGPLLALAVGVSVLALLQGRNAWRLVLPAVVGLAVGLVAAEHAGTTSYLGVDVPLLDAPAPTGADFTGEVPAPGTLSQEPISSARIRRALLTDAVEAVPERPLAGHGVGMLRDDSEDTRRMVEAGRIDPGDTLTHPHSVVVESAYSLGLPGLVLLLTAVGAALLALLRTIRTAARAPPTLLAAAFFAASAVTANLSGELGMDAYVWVAVALPVVVYAACREAAER